ncbi:MAG: beta-propeller fold lactonase family protein [Peptostreptococcus sp.]|uniref:lactonase family protein n=1 Tax=Peptostreptococcus sp. TaxID=1262 RepID=UPI002FC9BDFF
MKRIYLGGYTRKTNKGIHILKIDKNNDKLNEVEFIREEGATFLALSRDRKKLFSITTREEGGVASYKLENGRYNLVDTVGYMGKSPCHIYFDERQSIIYASNYHLGRLDIIKVDDNLEMKIINTINYFGHSIVSPDQDSSKCHMAIKDKDDEYLIVVNLGADCIYSYKMYEDGSYKLVGMYNTKAGMGPRHLVFDREGEYAYIIGELNSSIDVVKYNRKMGTFKFIRNVSTLPEGYEGENTASAIKISKDNRFLYASNRGHNSIAVFKIIENSKLELLQIEKTKGDTPRDFALIKDEEMILVGHQNGLIHLFDRDKETGKIKHLDGRCLNIEEIVCVLS